MILGRFFLLTILIPAMCMADSNRFTKEEVQRNSIKFIKTVFGENSPTLSDRIKFEGGVESLELDETNLMYGICVKKFKIQKPDNSKECFDKVITPRLKNPSHFESLYYKQLRKKLGVSVDMLEINSIYFNDGVLGEYAGEFIVVIDIKNPTQPAHSKKQLLLSHVPNQEDVVDEGTVHVKSIVIPIHEYVK